MSVNFDFNVRGVRQLDRRLKKASDGFKKANIAAINDTTKQLTVNVKKGLRKHLAAKAKYLSRRMWTRKATSSKPYGSMHFGTFYDMPLRAFPARQTKYGVNVQVLTGGKRTFYRGAFFLIKTRGTQSKTYRAEKPSYYSAGVFRRDPTGARTERGTNPGKNAAVVRVKGINATKVVRQSQVIEKERKRAAEIFNQKFQRRLARMKVLTGGAA